MLYFPKLLYFRDKLTSLSTSFDPLILLSFVPAYFKFSYFVLSETAGTHGAKAGCEPDLTEKKLKAGIRVNELKGCTRVSRL